jgi:hypothetical protein
MERYTIFIEVSWSSLGVVLGDPVGAGHNVGTGRTRMGGRKHRTNVYDACSGGVVVVA